MFRNKEVKQLAISFSFIAIIATVVGFIIDKRAGILVICTCLVLGVIFYLFTKNRYKNIAKISEEIDLVLHNEEHLFISDEKEGELSILQSEITKMTLRIREQNDALKREKKHLADSMADIAHQLRTPLTSTNLILTLVKKEPEEEKRNGLLREAEELFLQMDWLVTSLLKLSRLDAGIVDFKEENINIDDLVNASVRPFLISMELHNITPEISVPKDINITGDSAWLSEAIKNIIKNCIESMENDGKLQIEATDTSLYTEITIHDSGSGFAEEDLYHLFDRFYRGKNSGATGYGIGLALCKTIIIRQGGTISARNHLNGGALFTIRFPK